MEFNNHKISHIICDIINLTQLRQFYIIIYFKVDLFLIIYYLTYLIFLINFCNQFFIINFFNQFIFKLVMLLACDTLPL